MKNYLLISLSLLFLNTELFSQDSTYTDVEYSLIVEGNDSPYKNFQVVCFNKYFNLEQLPKAFQKKYNLTDRLLFKKKMLVEIFFSDTEKKGLDKIEIEEIKESTSDIIFKYNLVNSDSSNDSIKQSPFIVVQLPKNTKKRIRFIANGVELGKGKNLYIK